MKQLILIIAIALNFSTYAQDEKNVTLTVNGQGTTLEEAKQNALRSAIEQAFGVFISSNTEILNDELVKDEIVSVSNGNIQSFDIISETQISENSYVSSLRATVSVNKLTSFVESKGFEIEFKGGLFAQNIQMQELYENNELKAVENMIKVLKEISSKSFDINISASDPKQSGGNWLVPIKVDIIVNENFFKIPTLLFGLLNDLKMTDSEIQSYIKLQKALYPITFLAKEDEKGVLYFRNGKTLGIIIDFIYSLNNTMTNFKIDNGVERFSLEKYNSTVSVGMFGDRKNTLYLDDANFHIILKQGYYAIGAASLFHNSGIIQHASDQPNFDYRSLYMDGRYMIKIPGKGHAPGSANLFVDKNSKFYIKELLTTEKVKMSNHNTERTKFYSYDGPTGPTGSIGLVISFAKIQPNDIVVRFEFNDVRTLDELKKISKYKIVKNTE